MIAATATADTLEEAVKKAYEGVKCINFQDMFYRKDIAHRFALSPSPLISPRKANILSRAFKQKLTEVAMTYAGSGVDVDAGNALVNRIKAAVRSTRIPGADSEIGGFGGIFDLAAAGWTNPLLVAGIDGVGTKLKIACALRKHHSVGIDLVAMSVNDLLAQGAGPLFFLDYYSTSKLDIEEAAEFVEGVADGCRQAGCALVGGETAEMPGMYQEGDYDAAGCAVGAVNRGDVLPKLDVMVVGDVLIGLASNGVHSNGYSLIRKIVERAGLDWTAAAPWNPAASIGEEFLIPTRIYVKPLLKVANRGLIKGMSHITGGGLTENIPRMLPKHLVAEVDVSTWELSPLFKWLKKTGNVAALEFARTWNTGLGFVVVVGKDDVEEVVKTLQAEGETAVVIGKVGERTGDGCVLRGLDSWN